MLTGAVALAPVYLHLNGVAALFSVHSDTVHTASHDAMTMPVDTTPVDTRPMGQDAPASKHEHEGHAFCFFCVVLMTLQPSPVSPARVWLPTLPELILFDLEPQLKIYLEFEARPRAPPLV